jgi:branched-chain amino acid transport system ATP-binding protein
LASPDTTLELRGVHASYGKRLVLQDLSLSLAPGEIVTMLGNNGAGKTTTLRIAAGLKAASAGTVRLYGEDVARRSASRRALDGLGLVPEGVKGIFPSLTVRQNLNAIQRRTSSEQHGEGDWASIEAQLREAFADVLVDRIDQVAGSMSGGQRQMLAISLALMRHPTVLLLDEPSTGLAPLIIDRIFAVVARLAKSTGTAVLVVEQDVARALKIADRVVIVRTGSVVADFPREQSPPSTELWHLF